MDMQESEPEADDEQEDWMRVQQPDGDQEGEIPAYQISQPDQMPAEHWLAYWHQDNHYSAEELAHMDTWLMDEKRNDTGPLVYEEDEQFNIDGLNRDQLFAYNIVQHYLERNTQLLLRIEGFAGILNK